MDVRIGCPRCAVKTILQLIKNTNATWNGSCHNMNSRMLDMQLVLASKLHPLSVAQKSTAGLQPVASLSSLTWKFSPYWDPFLWPGHLTETPHSHLPSLSSISGWQSLLGARSWTTGWEESLQRTKLRLRLKPVRLTWRLCSSSQYLPYLPSTTTDCRCLLPLDGWVRWLFPLDLRQHMLAIQMRWTCSSRSNTDLEELERTASPEQLTPTSPYLRAGNPEGGGAKKWWVNFELQTRQHVRCRLGETASKETF